MAEKTRLEKLSRFEELMQELPTRLQVGVSTEWPEHELTMTQFKAMTYLLQGSQRMGDISRHLSVSLSSVTNLVGRLETKGLVHRIHDNVDRRVVTCELTEEGRITVTRLWQVGRERLVLIADRLSDEDLDTVIHAFELLVDAALRADDRRGGDSP